MSVDPQPTLTITSANTSNSGATYTLGLNENEFNGNASTATPLAKKATTCSNCGAEVPAGAKECLACKTKLSVDDKVEAGVCVEVEVEVDGEEECACPECGSMNDASAQCCDQCGTSMPDPEDQTEPPEATGEASDPEDVGEGPEMSTLPTWEAIMAVEGLPTSDGRYLMPGGITNRDLPLTLMAQTVTAEGHMGARVAGKITEIFREDRPDLGVGAVAIIGRGEFDVGEAGEEASRMVADEVLRGISVDLSASSVVPVDPNTLQPISEDDLDLADLLMGDFLRGISGELMGATLCPFPAFSSATVTIVVPSDDRYSKVSS